MTSGMKAAVLVSAAIAAAEYAWAGKAYDNNARDIQPANGRTIRTGG